MLEALKWWFKIGWVRVGPVRYGPNVRWRNKRTGELRDEQG